jgi:hypothetical protein
MVSTSGSQLLPQDAVQDIRTKLLPLATVLTPNIPEAKLLLENANIAYQDPQNIEDLIQLAKQLHELGPKSILLKGGHLPLNKERVAAKGPQEACIVVDVLYNGSDVTLLEADFLTSRNTHGTGCSLASAIAANLASGECLERAVRAAVRYVEAGIKTSVDMGRGNGPINHFHSLYSLPFAPYEFHFLVFSISLSMITTYLDPVVDSLNMFSITLMLVHYGKLSPNMNLPLVLVRARYPKRGSRPTSFRITSILYVIRSSLFRFHITDRARDPFCQKQCTSCVQGENDGINCSGKHQVTRI